MWAAGLTCTHLALPPAYPREAAAQKVAEAGREAVHLPHGLGSENPVLDHWAVTGRCLSPQHWARSCRRCQGLEFPGLSRIKSFSG